MHLWKIWVGVNSISLYDNFIKLFYTLNFSYRAVLLSQTWTHQTQTQFYLSVDAAGEVQGGRAEGFIIQSVLQPSTNPPDWVGQGGDRAPEPGDKHFPDQAATV